MLLDKLRIKALPNGFLKYLTSKNFLQKITQSSHLQSSAMKLFLMMFFDCFFSMKLSALSSNIFLNLTKSFLCNFKKNYRKFQDMTNILSDIIVLRSKIQKNCLNCCIFFIAIINIGEVRN